MSCEKIPGLNGIPTKAFKNLGSIAYLLLRKTILKYWHDAKYNPEAFTKLSLCILLKAGNLSNPNKWRGIALGDIAAELISLIIATRLTKHIATFGVDEQCSSLFRKGCVDTSFTLKLKASLQTLREHQKESHVLFVDLFKAYNSVN